MRENRLYRISNGKVIGGVAGGLAEFFGIDPTIIRIIFILLTVMGGGGLLLYVVLWIVVPEKYNIYPPYGPSSTFSRPTPSGSDTGKGETYEGYAAGVPPVIKPDYKNDQPVKGTKMDGGLIAGLVLILIGGFFLFERFIPTLNFGDFWPLLLVLIGVFMIIRGFPVTNRTDETASDMRRDDTATDNTRFNESGSRADKDNSTNNDLNI